MKPKSKWLLKNGPLHEGPEWIKDEFADTCMMCRIKFTKLTRRHHCRNCGHVFCGACAGYWHSIPDLDYSCDVRVCKNCKEELLHSQTEAVYHKLLDVPIVDPPFELKLFQDRRLRYINTCTLLSSRKRVIAIVDQWLIIANTAGFVKKVMDLDLVEKIYEQRATMRRKYMAADTKHRMRLLLKFPEWELLCTIHPADKSSDIGDLCIGTIQRINEALTGTMLPALNVQEEINMQEYATQGKMNMFNRTDPNYNQEYATVLKQLITETEGPASTFTASKLERLLKDAASRPKELLNKVRDKGRSRKPDQNPILEEIHELLATHEPLRLKALHSLLSRYIGREDELLEELKQTYLPELTVQRKVEELLQEKGLAPDVIQLILQENRQHEKALLKGLLAEKGYPVTETPAEPPLQPTPQETASDNQDAESAVSSTGTEEELEKMDVMCVRCGNMVSEYGGATGFTWQGRAAVLFKTTLGRSLREGQRTREQCSAGSADVVLLSCRKCGVEVGARFKRYRGKPAREGCSICYADCLKVKVEATPPESPVEPPRDGREAYLTKADLSLISGTPYGPDILLWYVQHKKEDVLSVPEILRIHKGTEHEFFKEISGAKEPVNETPSLPLEEEEVANPRQASFFFADHFFTANPLTCDGVVVTSVAITRLPGGTSPVVCRMEFEGGEELSVNLPQGRELELAARLSDGVHWWYPSVVGLLRARYGKWWRWVDVVKDKRKKEERGLRSILKTDKPMEGNEELKSVAAVLSQPSPPQPHVVSINDPSLEAPPMIFKPPGKTGKIPLSKPVSKIFPTSKKASFMCPEPVLAYPRRLIDSPPSPVPYWEEAADQLKKLSPKVQQSPSGALWDKPISDLL